jgi:6-pyruvoyltetrahydropterin/6-carboxytetrahydropterin synthase
MVIDYYEVEKIVNPVIEKLDHSFMVNIEDNIVLEFLEKINSKKVVVDFNSTAENICIYLLSEIKKCSLPANILAVKVRVYETQFDYAEETARLN